MLPMSSSALAPTPSCTGIPTEISAEISTAADRLFVAEPPPSYLHIPPVVVDCSALAGILFQEHWADVAAQQLLAKRLHAPHLLPVELASVALKKHKQGFSAIAADGLAQLANLDLTLHPINAEAVLSLAVQYQLTAYDAAYLWLAAELTCPLVTFDQQLAQAAQIHLGGLP